MLFSFFLLIAFGSTAFAAGRIVTLAGTGVQGYSGDGSFATNAQLSFPTGVARGPDGAVYICDTGNNRVRKVTRNGIIVTVAGSGVPGWSGDGGRALEAKLNEPYEVRFDQAGNIFWVERLSHTVRKCDAKTSTITTIAGSGKAGFSGDGGPAIQAQLSEPHSIGFDKEGDLFICDIRNQRIRKVDMKTGIISTFAGTGAKNSVTDGEQLKNAALNGPRAIDFEKAGNMWLALREGNAVYKIDPMSATIHHIAGTGKKGFTGNGGPAREATLSGPKGIALSPTGNVYFADTESDSIRMIEPRSGTIHLIACKTPPSDASERDMLTCQFSRPHGIFVDEDGSILIGDSEAQCIRVILPR